MTHTHVPFVQNSFLAALPHVERCALEPKLEYCRLPLRRTVHAAGESLTHVFFPTSGIVSLAYGDENGASTEFTLVGREGMIGIEPFLGRDTAANLAVVQAAGSAYRLALSDARKVFAEGGPFQSLVLQFAQRLILQLGQTAVCSRHHLVEQQLCRWLLLFLERLDGDDIEMTHELIAASLGVRRQSVTETARRLQDRNIISYSRGRITVLDRAALEDSACECYHTLKLQTASLS